MAVLNGEPMRFCFCFLVDSYRNKAYYKQNEKNNVIQELQTELKSVQTEFQSEKN